MRKIGRTGQHIKYLSCVLAVTIGLIQPCAALAVEEENEIIQEVVEEGNDDVSAGTVKYITGFEELAEEDAYFPCMYKPSLDELLSVFPETIQVWTEGAESLEELDVTWECEEDFDDTQFETYIFYPKWDETLYAIADTAADSVEIPSITVEVPVEGGIIKDLEGAKSALKNISEQKSILAIIYLCDQYEVKESPSEDSGTIRTVSSGQSVQITDVELGEYGNVWYQVLFYQNAAEYIGYVEREYLATSNEDFAGWEDAYIDLSSVPMVMAASGGYSDVDQFPASYQNALYALKDKHPNWIFVRMDTGLDWNTAIAKEMGDKSLIPSNTSGSWQNGAYGQGWSYASEGILKYYMDPRNFLSDPYIFQFEQLTYNESYHTTSSVQEVIKNSFMSSVIPGDSRTYAQAFTEIGQKRDVSPFHLAARVLQEQGTRGTSPLISGTYAGYEGYYNYFNVEAAGKTNLDVIINGLNRAVKSGWDTRFKSLDGGAAVIGANYITKGQDTVYLEKFNVSNGMHPNFTHQYMQNIQAPASEAANIRKAYNNAGALENSFVFKIPVYNNMPASACSKPEIIDSITLDKTTVGSLEVNKTVTLIPYVNGSKVDSVSNMTFTSNNASVATVDSQGKITGISPGTAIISCTRSGANTAACTVTVVKANPSVQTPVLSPYTYCDGLKLSDIVLPDGWTWEKGATLIAVGTFSYPALYTPADTTKYNVIKRQISFTVTKAIPNCQMPGRLEAKTGMRLGEIDLPSGFVWQSSTTTELNQAGEYTFYVSYNPNEDNYYTVDNLPVIVEVAGMPSEPSTDGQGGNTSSGSTSSGGITSGGNTSSSGTTTGGNMSSDDTTTGGNTSNGSTTGSGSTTSGSATSGETTTNGGATNGGSTTNGDTTSGGSATSSGSTTSGSTTSSVSTSSGDTMSSGNTTSISTTSGGSTTSEDTPSSSTTTGGNTSSSTTTSTNGTTGTSVPSGGVPNADAISSVSTTTVSSVDVPTGNASANNNSTTVNGGANGNSSNNGTTAGQSTVNNNPPASGTDNSNPPANSTVSSNPPADGTTNTNSSPPANSTAKSNSPRMEVASNSGTVTEQANNTVATSSQATAFKPSVTMEMEDTTILTVEKLQMAKEHNFNLVLDMGNSAKWSINMDSVDMSTVSEVDMGIAFRTENIPVELISKILDGNKYLEFTLAHDGEFGFDPVLDITFDLANIGRYANLFYYNPDADELEFICFSVIDESGVASFRMEHASSYIIIVSNSPMSYVPITGESTGHMTWWIVVGILVGLILIIGVFGIFFCRRKKQDNESGQDDEEDDGEDDEPEEGYLDDEDELYDLDDVKAEEMTKRKEIEKPAEQEDDEEESDWIEDEDWHEPEVSQKPENGLINRFFDDRVQDDWIDDDVWDVGDEWVEDDEWEKINRRV